MNMGTWPPLEDFRQYLGETEGGPPTTMIFQLTSSH